ncbi:MAG TPA: ABC transporter ATP-binding protein [Candidatus Sulfotelmatobacter sp.]|nr:ABC transporter ATP-binding protein [Candidatus Sulfotelmatobacter sp.]
MAAGIDIRGAGKSFGAVTAVRDVSLTVEAGEFFTLLGPSGCGKTTLLRIVAGFCPLDSGEIWIGGRRVDRIPPHRRNTGMVFQNYAVFPFLSVFDNVAYGLRARRVLRRAIEERVRRCLEMVQLADHASRMPHQLSGGQLQRVAIARCLAIEPEVLLLDEPLSNLDAKLRVQMRSEIRRLQQALKITALYVTHDQEEALVLSDRLAVMSGGTIQQLGRPSEVYHQPANAFTASFMGSTNLLRGRVVRQTEDRTVVAVHRQEMLLPRVARPAEAEVQFCLRPEAIRLVPERSSHPGIEALAGEVSRVEFLGSSTRYEVIVGGDVPLLVAAFDEWPARQFHPGDRVWALYDPARVTVLAGDGQLTNRGNPM